MDLPVRPDYRPKHLEYCGLVEPKGRRNVNPFITTVAGVYFFLAVVDSAQAQSRNFVVFVPCLLTIIYLFIGGLYTANKNAINWAYMRFSQM